MHRLLSPYDPFQAEFSQRNKYGGISSQHLCRFINSINIDVLSYDKEWILFDKALATEWLNDSHLLIGCKSNKLLFVDVESKSKRIIQRTPVPKYIEEQYNITRNRIGHNGIHTIKKAPGGILFLTGGNSPEDCSILSSDNQKCVMTLMGHKDWLFDACWLNARTVLTASRDTSVRVWRLPDNFSLNNTDDLSHKVLVDSVHRDCFHQSKVRCAAFNVDRQIGATLGVNGRVVHRDSSGLPVSSVCLHNQVEAAALSITEDGIVAVGTKHYLVLLDHRVRPGKILLSGRLNTGQQYIRSIECPPSPHYVSIGSGSGSLFFMDTRVLKSVPMLQQKSATLTQPTELNDLIENNNPHQSKQKQPYLCHPSTSVCTSTTDRLAANSVLRDITDTYTHRQYKAGGPQKCVLNSVTLKQKPNISKLVTRKGPYNLRKLKQQRRLPKQCNEMGGHQSVGCSTMEDSMHKCLYSQAAQEQFRQSSIEISQTCHRIDQDKIVSWGRCEEDGIDVTFHDQPIDASCLPNLPSVRLPGAQLEEGLDYTEVARLLYLSGVNFGQMYSQLPFACHCHAWAPSGFKVAVGGGSLLSGVNGCFAGIFS